MCWVHKLNSDEILPNFSSEHKKCTQKNAQNYEILLDIEEAETQKALDTKLDWLIDTDDFPSLPLDLVLKNTQA